METKAESTAQQKFNLQFSDNPDMEFKDLSDEFCRTYSFPGGEHVVVESPKALHVKLASVRPKIGSPHSHIIVLNTGMAQYIPAGWIKLTWSVKHGKKPVAF